jgi:CRP/FNR family cyclic AMP-dependent transcriptional regulator
MSILSNLDLIRRVPLFEVLTPIQAQQVAAVVTKRRYKRGECLVEEGKTTDALYLLLSGRARVLMTDHKGNEVILATLRTGDYVGEMSLIDGAPHSATVTTEVQTDVLILGRADFLRCVGDNAAVALSLMRGLVQRLRHADRKIGSLALMVALQPCCWSRPSWATTNSGSFGTRFRAKIWRKWWVHRVKWLAG